MTEIFAGTSAGDVPAERFFNAAGATSRAMHLNPVHRLAMNSEPEFLARNHLVLPIQGYLLSLADDGAAGRFGRHLLNARLRIEGLGFDPFNLLDFWPLRGIRTSPYAAFGWLFPEHVTFDAFSDYSAEAGVVVATDLLHLLPQVFQDAIDSPAPVRLSLWLPLWAESPLLDDPGFGYRWAIGVSM